MSASWEFYRLCDESGWDREDPDRKAAHQDFKAALVQQFNAVYGTDVNDIGAWQNLCHVVRIDPVPEDLHACREVGRSLSRCSLAHVPRTTLWLIILGSLLHICQPR